MHMYSSVYTHTYTYTHTHTPRHVAPACTASSSMRLVLTLRVLLQQTEEVLANSLRDFCHGVVPVLGASVLHICDWLLLP